MHDDKELIDLLKEEGFLEEVKVENIDSDNATQGEVLMADGSGGAEWSEIEAGMENPMTAKDDLIIGGTDGAPARLAKGSAGQVLQVGSDGLEWATPSGGGGDDILELDYNNDATTSNFQLTDAQYNNIINFTYMRMKIQNSSNYHNGYFIIDKIYYDIPASKYVISAYRDRGLVFENTTNNHTWFGTEKDESPATFFVYMNTKRIQEQTGVFPTLVPVLRTYNLDQTKFNALFCQKDAPDTDGTYVLKCTVVSGVKTYTWVSE